MIALSKACLPSWLRPRLSAWERLFLLLLAAFICSSLVYSAKLHRSPVTKADIPRDFLILLARPKTGLEVGCYEDVATRTNAERGHSFLVPLPGNGTYHGRLQHVVFTVRQLSPARQYVRVEVPAHIPRNSTRVPITSWYVARQKGITPKYYRSPDSAACAGAIGVICSFVFALVATVMAKGVYLLVCWGRARGMRS